MLSVSVHCTGISKPTHLETRDGIFSGMVEMAETAELSFTDYGQP